MTKTEFLNKYYPSAVLAVRGTTLLPETLVTQLIYESGWNLSELASKYHNLFGIKSGSRWTGKVVSKTTREENTNGTYYWITGTGKLYSNRTAALNDNAKDGSLFRVYGNDAEGMKGWVNFLTTNTRYKKVFQVNTPAAQFQELQNAGYAGTSLTYASNLTTIYNGLKNTIAKINIPPANNTGMASISTIIIIGLILASFRGFA